MTSPRELLLSSFNAALAAADPLNLIAQHLPSPPKGKTLVVGAGKAAASMALAVEQQWPSLNHRIEGLVVTRYQHGLLTNHIKVIEAGHPVPDEAGNAAAKEIFRLVKTLTPNDQLLVLLSGGGSSLMNLPAEGLAMKDIRDLTTQLLRSGAPIQEMNVVRKHLSAIQGGRLAAACRAPIHTLIISDVVGDDPTHIASGTCVGDPSTYAEAIDILKRYNIQTPASIQLFLEMGQSGSIPETPKPGDPALSRVKNIIIAKSQTSLLAAQQFFTTNKIPSVILGDTITGEAREVAKAQGALVRQIRQYAHPWAPPIALLSGGECTVTVTGTGQGGRCSDFLLSLGLDLKGCKNTFALACDTDGIDGSESNAGALLTPDALTRARGLGLNPLALLHQNDSYAFFHALGDLVLTGPTRTNVNDYRAILIGS